MARSGAGGRSTFAFRRSKDAASASGTSASAKTLTKSTDEKNEGKKCSAKFLYGNEHDNNGNLIWQEEYPDSWKGPVENEETQKHALLIRKTKSSDGRKQDDINSIVIQSPFLKQVLGFVLKGYPGITTSLDRLQFDAPFEPFVHRWEKLTEALENEQHAETKKHIELLHNVLSEELVYAIGVKNDFVKNSVISYTHLWTIFQPGSLLYSRLFGQDRVTKFQNAYDNEGYTGTEYHINSNCVVWEGEKFAQSQIQHVIKKFQGTVPINQLPIYPIEFHADAAELEARLTARGKKYESLSGYHYKAYKGKAIDSMTLGNTNSSGRTTYEETEINSRIVIDEYSYTRLLGNSIDNTTPLESTVSTNEDSDDEDYAVDSDQETLSPQKPELRTTSYSEAAQFTPEHYLLCSPVVHAYSLQLKRWQSFFIEPITDITFSNAAFESLVLPEDQKELILSFAESQVKYKDQFDDVIAGKGQGIIMLLSGPPGVGKTLTAESVAENMHTPLYQIGAGELGTQAYEIEQQLERIFTMAVKWDAVLLLDECDVFLEKRSVHDLQRNALVSTFLRMLEYHSGVLFLTTNRVQSMDPAFQSRIHVSLEYPGLNEEAREKIWRNFLARGRGSAEFGNTNMAKLAKLDLNGRQIKNVIKTAQLLASRKEMLLSYDHVKTVLKIEGKGQGVIY
ncbi:MAG: hypothetical protein M1814_004243 [Vezdaea aestivalis]|nr:MAG: hypothetical protein M1814_004243 [Vezdaea aestivalis]